MKVSVCLITCNHEVTIAQALDSVLSQQTTYPYELVVGVDHSTDRTAEIVQEYAYRFAPKLRVLTSGVRLGLLRNFERTFSACDGQYVALLDGDDFWTHAQKLERQVSFLDAHPECSICFHDTAVMAVDGTLCSENYTGPDRETFSTIEALFETNFIATCAAMLRRNARLELPDWYSDCLWEDWPLYILFAEMGMIGYLKQVMSVYRSHGAGLWSSLGTVAQLQATIDFLIDIDARLGYRYREEIRRSVSRHRVGLEVARERERSEGTS